jgi:hypothetical protein
VGVGVVGWVAGPDDGGAEKPVEQEVAFEVRHRRAGKDQHGLQAEACGGGGGQSGVVGLRRAGGDHGVGALGQYRRQGPFEFADFVAAGCQAGEVVAFEPQVIRL